MTTLVAFTPTPTATPPFQQTVTLDGTQYSLTARWNLYAARWYYTITDQNGNVVIHAALVGSPDDYDIYLAPGIFSSSTILYRSSTGNFELSP